MFRVALSNLGNSGNTLQRVDGYSGMPLQGNATQWFKKKKRLRVELRGKAVTWCMWPLGFILSSRNKQAHRPTTTERIHKPNTLWSPSNWHSQKRKTLETVKIITHSGWKTEQISGTRRMLFYTTLHWWILDIRRWSKPTACSILIETPANHSGSILLTNHCGYHSNARY